MSIPVSCQCGKAFKVKERLAGKVVRCPACKKPLRIPAAQRTEGAGESHPHAADEHQEAVLKFEVAQRRKQEGAQADAVYREEQHKLIESYDQLAGKAGKQKGMKHELAGATARKATIFTKIADFFGVIWKSLIFRYVLIVVLLGGATFGSIYLVRFVTSYVQRETAAPTTPKEDRVKELFAIAQKSIDAKKWSAARDALDEIVRLDPTKEMNRDYKRLRKMLKEAFSAQP
jgi:hypothetical protein